MRELITTTRDNVTPIITSILIMGLLILGLVGCGGSGGGGSNPPPPPPTNTAPVANAGPNQNVVTGSTVSLDGSNSSDADGDTITYSWTLASAPAGSSATLAGASSATASFTADIDGTYTVSLTVSDGTLSSSADTVDIVSNTTNSIPIASAGPDQNVLTGALVNLDGSASSDADGDPLTYAWSFVSVPSASAASISNPDTVNPTFTTDVDGAYVVQLVVNDGASNSPADTIDIVSSSSNSIPVANAGPDQDVVTGALVILDGSGSSDANSDPLTYAWSFISVPSGSAATIININVVNPTFTADLDGTYVVQLIVNDGTADSPPDTVSISSTSAAPVVSDNFDGDGPLLGYTTNNGAALPDVSRTAGRYRADLTDNSGNVTLHFNNSQGRLDAKLVTFPFEYIGRNIGIGTQADSQVAPPFVNTPITLAGIQVHVTDLNDRNSAHIVVGHSDSVGFTVEGKNTVNSSSVFDTAGANVLPLGRADLRVVGNANRTLTVFWQAPNPSPGVQADNWTLYAGTIGSPPGDLPGPAPTFGNTVYIGLITYAAGTDGVPFVGTCDSVQLVGE